VTPPLTKVMDRVRGAAPTRRPNVRSLATQAALSRCGLATMAFGLGVSTDRLLTGTGLEVPFGQSKFAFARGQQFERHLTDDNCKVLFEALQSDLSFDTTANVTLDLRAAYPPNLSGMIARAAETKRVLRLVIDGDPTAPNLIVGAVFKTSIAGVDAYLEADAVAARDVNGATIYTGEIKSFPIVDGRIDKDKLGKAADQVAVYQLLIQEAIEQIGGDPETVSRQAMIITPINTGFKPKISLLNITARVDRSRQLLSVSAPIDHLVAAVPTSVSFGAVADDSRSDADRLRSLDLLADAAGTHWCSSCLPNCGLARACRRRTFDADDTALSGEVPVRLTPGITTMSRTVELARGATAEPNAVEAAATLRNAYDLYQKFAPLLSRVAS
jgi:hypothetical protein